MRRSPDLARGITAGLKHALQQAHQGDRAGRNEWLGQETGHNLVRGSSYAHSFLLAAVVQIRTFACVARKENMQLTVVSRRGREIGDV